ncbi:reverse transcriptase protein [Rutstroemia sp. NJR-2017a WRK4]|nr:reverse transcriptase protein [Rutstroemia sp. NJR-2017a WRK4]
MSAGGVFSETLQSITTTKLTELSKRRNNFETKKQATQSALSREPDQRKKLRLLLDSVQDGFGIKSRISKKRSYINTPTHPRLEILINNVERFLAQAEYDPSISLKALNNWERSLMQQMNIQSSKYQYATLYGELVTEWLSKERESEADNVSETSEGFQQIKEESEARKQGRSQWEKLVFEPCETDQVAITAYLRSLFGNGGENTQAIQALFNLRKSVEEFEVSLSSPGQFNEDVLTWTINGLLASGLLSEEKRAALKDFLASPVILNEVADVLNMRMAAIDTWEWDMEVAVEQRRHINGTHHMFIDEDLLQALFLQYIGVKWSVFLKKAFRTFLVSPGAWSPLRKPVTDKARREYFLGSLDEKPSVQSTRQVIYNYIYFMSQLPNSEDEGYANEDGEEEVQYVQQSGGVNPAQTLQPQQMQAYQMQLMQLNQAPAQDRRMMVPQQQQQPQGRAKQKAGMGRGGAMRHRKIQIVPEFGFQTDYADDESELPENPPKTQMEIKQFLLHLLSTEILTNTRFHGEFTCTRSEFDSWSPSLPHSTIFCVLSFFGLSKRWLGFFLKFLEAPLKFVEDGPDSEVRTRKRGVPGAHALSSVCGEVILFCLDYAVNQKTDGAVLYRMHDDFWLWSPSHQTVVKGWEAIVTFSDIMGVTLDKGKTGTVRITKDSIASRIPAPINPILPEGEIRWGFLKLDPITGEFTIDQPLVSRHVEELSSQLRDKKSIFSWIQAWNTYAGRFFSSNFGKPAHCFGRDHVDAMLSSFKQIQQQIFSDTNVVEYLKTNLRERFAIDDIPDGYFYFPAGLGGLELHNPFVGLLQIRGSITADPGRKIDDFLVAEKENYRRLKRNWIENGSVRNINPSTGRNYNREMPTEFMSFEEFTKHREDFYNDGDEGALRDLYASLLEQPDKETVQLDEGDDILLNGVTGSVEGMDDGYWKWIVKLYGEEMKERFGGLSVVDKGLLPIGMVNLFRSGKVKWQG